MIIKEKRGKSAKRPILIWILSVFMFISFLLSIPLAVIGQALYGQLYSSFLLLSSTINFFAFVGIFMMKRWGFRLYLWTFIVAQIIMLLENWWTLFAFLIPLALVIATSFYYKRMT